MLKDMTGFQGEYFKVIEFIEYRLCSDGKRRRFWKCLCRCGNERFLSTGNLNFNSPRSCGCHIRVGLGNRTNHAYLNKHGLSKHPIYRLWSRIRSRCYTTKFPRDIRNYRNKGVIMHESWHNPKIFYDWCIANGWKHGLSIDRIDNDGNYEPDNCQFLTVSENAKKLWKDRPLLNSGSNNKWATINEHQASEIKKLLQEKVSSSVIKKMFNISNNMIYQIKNNITWKHVV